MHRQTIDETGKTYGRLTVLSYAGVRRAQAHFICRCACGKLVAVSGSSLRRGTVSCGCYRRENTARRKTIHGKAAGGHSRVYRIWNAMKQRCHNPNQPHYERYGGRGIVVCDAWRSSFAAFYAAMGDPPTVKHSLDRMNNDGNYEPGNVRWATAIQQQEHKRKRRWRRRPVDQQ